MALDGQQNGDSRARLAASWDEVRPNTTHALNLSGGQQINLPLLRGTLDGQVLRREDQRQAVTGSSVSTLLLTISVAPAEHSGPTPFPQVEAGVKLAFSPTPSPPSISSPSYLPVLIGAPLPAFNPSLDASFVSYSNAPMEAATPAYGNPQLAVLAIPLRQAIIRPILRRSS